PGRNREVRCGFHVVRLRAIHGEANRVIDLMSDDFVVANQAGCDRQTRGIRRCPAFRALAVAGTREIPLGAVAAVPAVGAVLASVALIERARALLNYEHVTVTVAVGRAVAFDLDAAR